MRRFLRRLCCKVRFSLRILRKFDSDDSREAYTSPRSGVAPGSAPLPPFSATAVRRAPSVGGLRLPGRREARRSVGEQVFRHGKVQRVVVRAQGAELTLTVPRGNHVSGLLIADEEVATWELLPRAENVADLLRRNLRRARADARYSSRQLPARHRRIESRTQHPRKWHGS